ncbi:28S ribosomal protein S29, mitochondrial [Armadillidium vulgare]|nr:28S ribosomal protein S29, mitochondrial [Armadillidium vulgare]
MNSAKFILSRSTYFRSCLWSKNLSSVVTLDCLTESNTKVPRTSLNAPREHTKNHIGMWYNIESNMIKRLFTYEGMTQPLKELTEIFRETSIMIREPAVSVIDFIQRSDLSVPPNKFILYGKHGTGKTFSLLHIIHHFAEENWAIVHCGYPVKWCTLFKEILPSVTREGYYDHTTDASIWLKHFQLQNHTILQNPELVTMQDYHWTQREITPKGSPLTSIIDFAIGRSRYASECVFQLLKELKQHAQEGRLKLAVVIDGINSLYVGASHYRDTNRNFVPLNKLTLIEAFKPLLRSDWKGGVIVGSVDIIMSTKDRRESHLPRYLLTREGWETLDPFVPILVDKYSEKEFESAVNYYLDRRWLQHPAGASKEGKEELEFLSGSYPAELLKLVHGR